MTEHQRNILVTGCLESNAYYSMLRNKHLAFSQRNTVQVTANQVIAEAYMTRIDTINQKENY